MTELLAQTERTARRPGSGWRWQCWWCRDSIVAGERYLDQRIKDDSGVNTIRVHPECSAACARDPYYSHDEVPLTSAQPRGKTQDEVDDEARAAHERARRAS